MTKSNKRNYNYFVLIYCTYLTIYSVNILLYVKYNINYWKIKFKTTKNNVEFEYVTVNTLPSYI